MKTYFFGRILIFICCVIGLFFVVIQAKTAHVQAQSPVTTPILRNGDVNNDGIVNGNDIQLVLENWLASITGMIDQYGDGKINALDFTRIFNFISIPTNTPTQSAPTPTSTPHSVSAFSVGTGFTDVTPRQIVRTNSDKVYIFGGQSESSSVLRGYWMNGTGIPTGTASFNGSIQVTEAAAIIQTDVVYDGANMIHVLMNLQNGSLIDHPFDLTMNTFKSIIVLTTGNPTVNGNYLGSGGVSGMFDTNGTLHIAYWSGSNHIMYKAYSYASGTNSLTTTSGPTQIDIAGASNHPHLVVSPSDNSVTVAWVSEATSPAKILARSRQSSGAWGSVENVSTAPVWISTNAGLNIDQGPNMVIEPAGRKDLVYMENFDSTGDYGHVHFVTSTGSGWIDASIPSTYTHDPALSLTSAGEIFLLGHGHPNNTACKNMTDICIKKRNNDGSWGISTLFAAPSGSDSYDASPSIKWSVVGFNRPETVEFLWFRANSGSYQNTTIMYGKF